MSAWPLPKQPWDLRLHLVTDERQPFGLILETAVQAVAGGVTVVQYRNKTLGSDALKLEVVELSRRLRGAAALVVNDRLDEVCSLRAAGVLVEGVHLGQSDASPMLARELLGSSALIGWTANTEEHAESAKRFPTGTIDYLGVGVIHSTNTKADAPPVLGLEGFAQFVRWTNLPAVGIGGIQPSDVAALAGAGASGVAVVSALSETPNPRATAAQIIGEFEKGKRES